MDTDLDDAIHPDGGLWPPTSPISLPGDMPRGLVPYTAGPPTCGGMLLHTAASIATRTHSEHDPGMDVPEIMDAGCRAALGCWASITSSWGGDDIPALQINASLWCAMPLWGGHLAAHTVSVAYRDHPDTAEDDRLHELIDGLIREIWPTRRSMTHPGQQALTAASHLHRHLSTYSVSEHHRGILDLIRVGQRTTWRERQVTLHHLIRAVQLGVVHHHNRPHLAQALIQVLDPTDW